MITNSNETLTLHSTEAEQSRSNNSFQAHSEATSIRTCWILGDQNVKLQRALSRKGLSVICSINAHHLNCAKMFRELMDNLTRDKPSLLWVNLPGTRTPEGNHKDRRIALHIKLLCERVLELPGKLIIEGATRNPAWNNEFVKQIKQRKGMTLANIPWCALRVEDDKLPVNKNSTVLTNLHVPDALSICCGKEKHVNMRLFPERIIAQYAEALVHALLPEWNDSTGVGPAAASYTQKSKAELRALGPADDDLGEHAD